MAKALKVALEGLMELDVAYPCKQETSEDRVELIQDQDRGYEEREKGELVRASLALCLYIVSRSRRFRNRVRLLACDCDNMEVDADLTFRSPAV